MNRWLSHFLILASLWLLLVGGAQAASIQTELSRNPVALNESFDLSFVANEDVSGNPDFGPLQADFEILNQSTSNSIQIVNGSMKKEQRWNLTLMAKKAGNLRIPAISFGSDQSDPLPLKVMEPIANPSGDQEADLVLKLEVEPKSVYVQQQAVLKVKLFIGTKIGSGDLSEPVLDDPTAVVKKLGDDRQYDTNLNGRRYKVVERRYTIFPQKSGSLAISPIVFTGEVVTGASSRSLFFSRPQGQIRRLQSQGATIDVKPIPASVTGAWLPSNNLQLTEDWPTKAEIRVGEPITRTLLLLADGLTASQLPTLQPDLPAELKQYPDQPQTEDREADNGVTGVRQQKIAIVPTRPGEYHLPPVEVTWWNTETDKPESASLPERVLSVLPAAGAPAQAAPPSASQAPVALEKAAPPPTQAEAAAKAPETAPATSEWIWRWISLALAAGWLGTILAWWLSRRGANESMERKAAGASPSAPKPKLDQVKLACERNDPARVSEELLRWGAARWPSQAPRSLGAIARLLPPEAATEVGALERVLYAPQPNEWSGAALWEALRDFGAEEKGDAAASDGLSPLYPH